MGSVGELNDMLKGEGLAKQSSAGLLCRCIRCHGLFKLFSHYVEKDAVYSEFECNCGRVIKIKETKDSRQSKPIKQNPISFLEGGEQK